MPRAPVPTLVMLRTGRVCGSVSKQARTGPQVQRTGRGVGIWAGLGKHDGVFYDYDGALFVGPGIHSARPCFLGGWRFAAVIGGHGFVVSQRNRP